MASVTERGTVACRPAQLLLGAVSAPPPHIDNGRQASGSSKIGIRRTEIGRFIYFLRCPETAPIRRSGGGGVYINFNFQIILCMLLVARSPPHSMVRWLQVADSVPSRKKCPASLQGSGPPANVSCRYRSSFARRNDTNACAILL